MIFEPGDIVILDSDFAKELIEFRISLGFPGEESIIKGKFKIIAIEGDGICLIESLVNQRQNSYFKFRLIPINKIKIKQGCFTI